MKISIITVSYNSSTTIYDTIKSILNQTYSNIEYIIIDGNSNDATIEIIKEYETKFNGRMHWISEKDYGIYDAMNKGIKLATGDVIGFLNSDDFFVDENIVKNIVQVFKEKSIDAVYADVLYVDSKNTQKVVRKYSSSIFKRWTMRFGLMPAHPSFYLKREIVEKYGGFNIDYKIAADFDLLFRLLYVERINTAYICKDFVKMREGGVSNVSWKNRLRINNEHIKSIRSYGFYSAQWLEFMRYGIKILEIFRARLNII